MQLNLTDYEAQLLEQRLRGRTVSFSDADHLTIQGIADRLLAGEVRDWAQDSKSNVGDDWIIISDYTEKGESVTIKTIDCLGITRPTRIKGSDGNTYVGAPEDKHHIARRETDEYACSCGARWDVSDGDDHPR